MLLFLIRIFGFVSIPTMSCRKRKIIKIENDEEIDSYPHILREPLFDPQIPLGDVDPSCLKSVLRQPTPETSLSSDGNKLNRNSSEQALSLDETPRSIVWRTRWARSTILGLPSATTIS